MLYKVIINININIPPQPKNTMLPIPPNTFQKRMSVTSKDENEYSMYILISNFEIFYWGKLFHFHYDIQHLNDLETGTFVDGFGRASVRATPASFPTSTPGNK